MASSFGPTRLRFKALYSMMIKFQLKVAYLVGQNEGAKPKFIKIGGKKNLVLRQF